MRELKVAYITVTDPMDKHSWSGTNYFILKSLKGLFSEVDVLGPIEPSITLFFLRAFNFLSLRLLNKRFDYRHSVVLSKVYARIVSKKLRTKSYDLIVAPAASALLAYVDTHIPIIYINDRTIKGAVNYHKQLSNLFDFSLKQSILIDSLALNKANIACFPSYWASQSAIQDYQLPESKVKTIPFGANIEIEPTFSLPKGDQSGELKLLFIGVNWEEKGGDIAFETLLELDKAGIKSKLIVCGCEPPLTLQHPDLFVEGFLRKDNAEEYEILIGHFKTADFLILPTRFEAYGLVFCEAGAYSLPVLASDTGGIPTIVKDGENGFLFPLEARGDVYAKKITWALKQPGLIEKMRAKSQERFVKKFNWKIWADEFKIVVDELIPVRN